MGNFQFFQIFDEKSTALNMVNSEVLKVLKKLKIAHFFYHRFYFFPSEVKLYIISLFLELNAVSVTQNLKFKIFIVNIFLF